MWLKNSRNDKICQVVNQKEPDLIKRTMLRKEILKQFKKKTKATKVQLEWNPKVHWPKLIGRKRTNNIFKK